MLLGRALPGKGFPCSGLPRQLLVVLAHLVAQVSLEEVGVAGLAELVGRRFFAVDFFFAPLVLAPFFLGECSRQYLGSHPGNFSKAALGTLNDSSHTVQVNWGMYRTSSRMGRGDERVIWGCLEDRLLRGTTAPLA